MKTAAALVRNSNLAILFHIAPRLANVLTFILIGRWLDVSMAGIFTLAVTYLLILSSVTRGLDDLVVRQVAREPELADRYLTNFFFLRLFLALALYPLLWLFLTYGVQYDDFTRLFILIFALSVVPDSLIAVLQAVLMGQGEFSLPAWTITGINLVKFLVAVLILKSGLSLLWLGGIWLLISFFGLALLAFMVSRRIRWWSRRCLTDWSLLRQHWTTALPFLGITLVLTLEGQSDVVILSSYHSAREIGWYGAATTIISSLVILSQAYRQAVYPLMTRYSLAAPDKLAFLYTRSMRYMALLAFPMAVGVAILAAQIVPLVFGPNFSPTIQVLVILAPVLLIVYLNVPNSRLMLSMDRQRWSLIFLVLSMVTNIVLNLILVPRYAATGAAISRLCSISFYFSLSYVYVTHNLVRQNLLALLGRPALAAGLMALVVWPLRDMPLWAPIIAGMISFGIAVWLLQAIPKDDWALIKQSYAARRRGPTSDHLSKST